MVILLLIAIFIAIPYVVGPILLWANGSRMDPTKLGPADPSRALPTAAESHFWKATHYFSSCGFEKVGDRLHESNKSDISFYKQLWRHSQTGEVTLVGAILKGNDATFCNTFVAFMHERANGALISTSNFNLGARSVLDPPGTSKLVVAHQDPAEIRALHQAHLAAHGNEKVRPLRVGDPYEFSRRLDAMTRDVALQQKRFRIEGDALRITAWGAVFGIWNNLPPLKWKHDKQERELLERVMRAGAATGLASRSRNAA